MAVNSQETIATHETGETKSSKTSSKNELSNVGTSKIPKRTFNKKLRAVTADGVTSRGTNNHQIERPASANAPDSRDQPKEPTNREIKSQTTQRPKTPLRGTRSHSTDKPASPTDVPGRQTNDVSSVQNGKQREELIEKKRSRIPSLKNFETKKTTEKPGDAQSKLLVKIKPTECPNGEKTKERRKKTSRTGGQDRLETIKIAMSRNFSNLVPQYETQLKKIIDTWVNAIYCSLSMRRNLVKLLFEEFPDMDKSQFCVEDETLLRSFFNARSITKSEICNFQQVINSLIESQNKMRKEYEAKAIECKEVAKAYNCNWEALQKKMKDLERETRELQDQIPKLEEKRQEIEKVANEKIQKLEKTLATKAEEINKLTLQLNTLRQKESNFKGNVLMRVEEYKDIKAEVDNLNTVEKEFEELKTHYVEQKELFQKKIKDLEILVDEKKKTLAKETTVKKKLEDFLKDMQTHQKQLYQNAGKDLVEFILGRNGKLGKKEQLWASAVKLVLKAFQIQVKKLERDRNKMLLELNSNDLENFNTLATALLQKESFLNSIKHQMNAFYKMSKSSRSQSQTHEEIRESQITENEKEI